VIGHIIGTPLNVIAGRAAMIRADPTGDAVMQNARRIEEQVERLARRIRRLIDYLTVPEPDKAGNISVARVMRAALALYVPIAAQRGVDIDVEGEPPAAMLDEACALVVLTSLLGLAARVAPKGERIVVSATESPLGGVQFELVIPGLKPPRARIDRLDPPDGEVGSAEEAERLQVLSVCFAIAQRHGGRVDVKSRGKAGSVIRFECPGA
jgi:signal transduction histidine kinase